jgi:cytochrome c
MLFAVRWVRVTVAGTSVAMLSACGSPIDEAAAARGRIAAETCLTCHSFDSQHKIGPHLRKVMGRTAGSVPGYEFSEAMRNSNIVWTDKTLQQYLTAPLQMVPGTKMAMAPLTQQQVTDVVEFIKSQQ